MLSIPLKAILPTQVAVGISGPSRADIDIGFDKADVEFSKAVEQWRADFAVEQAEKRLSFVEQAELWPEREARQRRGLQEERADVLLECALIAWHPVHKALCELGAADYSRYNVRALSRQALDAIVRIIDRAYDRAVYLGRKLSLGELWHKPFLIDRTEISAISAISAWAMAKIERHPVWVAGQAAWRTVAERAAQPPGNAAAPEREAAMVPPATWAEFMFRLASCGISSYQIRQNGGPAVDTLENIRAGRGFNKRLILPKLIPAVDRALAGLKPPLTPTGPPYSERHREAEADAAFKPP